MRKAVTFIGKVFFWGVVIVGLVAAGALLLITSHMDEAVRAEVQRVFSEHYQGFHVAVRSAQRVEGQGMFVRGLSIKDPNLDGPRSELLYVDEVFFASKNSIDELVLGELQIDHVDLRRMALRMIRQPDGSWSATKLLPLPSLGGAMPTATVEDGTVEIFDPTSNPPTTLTLRRVELKLAPGQYDGLPRPSKEVMNMEGRLAGDHFQQLQFRGWLDPEAGTWSIAGDVQGLSLAQEARESLPSGLDGQLASLGNLRGRADFAFSVTKQATGDATSALPFQFDINGQIYDARYDDPQLPFPLRDITAQLQLNNAGLQIKDLVAKGGGATLHLTANRSGWQANSPLRLEAQARQFHVDDSIAERLPEQLAHVWQQYRPTGLLDADVLVTFDGQRWTPELTIRCLDTSFRYEKFPYPINAASGTITLKGDVLAFDINAQAADKPLTLKGRFESPMDGPAGWLEFVCDGPVPIDARWMAALDTEISRPARDLMLAMKARGGLSGSGRIDVVRLASGAAQVNEHVLWRIHDGSVEFEKFPYPLHHISGEIEIWNGQFTFRKLQGRNDSGVVACDGTFNKDAPQPQLTLNFVCRDLALEDEIRLAFPPAQQQLWANLRPQGTIDRLNMQVRYFPVEKRLDIDAVAVKWPETQSSTGQPISIFPKAFPYRLNQVEGEVRYRNGYLELTKLRATHENSHFNVNGFCQMAPDGSWRFQLSQLNTEDLAIDRDLIAALPEKLAAGISPLNLRGPVTLAGAIEFRHGPAVDDVVASDWDLTIDLENGQVNCGIALTNIHGQVRLTGANNVQGMYSRGEVNIDSLMYKGFQLTGVKGPLWIDRERVAFGAWAEAPTPGKTPRRLQADILGGTVAGDIHISLTGDKYFTMQAQLDKADLAQFAREHLPRGRNVSGQASGNLRLSGTARGTDTLRGDGRVWLRNAVIEELPVMVALLKVLKVKPLDKTAFTSSDVEYRINGEDIYIDRMVFNGDAISLRGAGEVNLDRRVNLKFYTMVGNESRRIPIVWPLLADASRRILMIEVTGSLDNPVTTRNVLPGLNGTIERLFSDELGTANGQTRPAGSNRPQYQR